MAPQIAADKTVVGVVAGTFSGELAKAGKALEDGGSDPSSRRRPRAGISTARSWKGFARIIAPDADQGYGAAAYLEQPRRRLEGRHRQRRLGLWRDQQTGRRRARRSGRGLGRGQSGRRLRRVPSGRSSDAKPDFVYFAGRPSVAGARLLTKLRGRRLHRRVHVHRGGGCAAAAAHRDPGAGRGRALHVQLRADQRQPGVLRCLPGCERRQRSDLVRRRVLRRDGRSCSRVWPPGIRDRADVGEVRARATPAPASPRRSSSTRTATSSGIRPG